MTEGYDAMNRMTSAAYTPPGGSALAVVGLTYDSLGRRSGLAYGDGSSATYGWDAADRLTSLAHAFPSSGSNVTLGYSYDPASRALTRTLSNSAYAYGTAPGTNAYGTANSLNQYPTVGGQAFAWSAQGPLQTDQAQSYGYDELNRLGAAVPTASGRSVTMSADALGLTIARSTAGLATNALTYFSGNGQSASNAMERLYANTGGGWAYQGDRALVQGPGADEFLAYVDVSGAIYYPHVDESGTAIALSQGTGAPAILNYDPFGVSANPILDQPSGAQTYAYRYTGQRLDPLSGVYDYKARAYAPGLGRFLQTDPAGLSASPNLYAYVGNNPVGAADPSGLLQLYDDSDCCDPATTPFVVLVTSVSIGYSPATGGGTGGGAPGASPQGTSVAEAVVMAKRPQSKLCNNAGAVAFAHAHQADAAKLAAMNGNTTEEILGLSWAETGPGGSTLSNLGNNYFSMEGPNSGTFSYATGTGQTSGGATYATYSSYYTSGLSFLTRY